MTDQPTPLHEQVRTLEADLVMCREQLAQETERAESYRLDVAAIRGALDAPDDADVNQLIDVVHEITELAEKAEKMATSPGSPRQCRIRSLRGWTSWQQPSPSATSGVTAPSSPPTTSSSGAQLPIPDATNPAHLQWTARMIELAQPGGDLPYRASQRNILAEHLRADADRLEAAQQQAIADEESRRGISNGQLLAMETERRSEVIASLGPEVRRKLANIASLGASRLISQVIADKYDWRTANRMASAREFTDLAASLLQGGESR